MDPKGLFLPINHDPFLPIGLRQSFDARRVKVMSGGRFHNGLLQLPAHSMAWLQHKVRTWKNNLKHEFTPPKNNMTGWKIHHECRCISYRKWRFSNVMLVFRGAGAFGISIWPRKKMSHFDKLRISCAELRQTSLWSFIGFQCSVVLSRIEVNTINFCWHFVIVQDTSESHPTTTNCHGPCPLPPSKHTSK